MILTKTSPRIYHLKNVPVVDLLARDFHAAALALDRTVLSVQAVDLSESEVGVQVEGVLEVVLDPEEVLELAVLVLEGDLEVPEGDPEVLKDDLEVLEEDLEVLEEDLEVLRDSLEVQEGEEVQYMEINEEKETLALQEEGTLEVLQLVGAITRAEVQVLIGAMLK